MQHLSHALQRFLTLGGVAWASDHPHVVLADVGVVDFVDDDAVLVNDFLDRLGLHRVDLGNRRLTVFTDDAGHALRVVNLGDQIHQLTTNMANSTGQIVHIVIGSNVALALAGQDGFA